MYTSENFKSKAAIKRAIADPDPSAHDLTVYQPNGIGLAPDFTGKVYLEGPHYPAPHTWYAVGFVVNGQIVKVS